MLPPSAKLNEESRIPDLKPGYIPIFISSEKEEINPVMKIESFFSISKEEARKRWLLLDGFHM